MTTVTVEWFIAALGGIQGNEVIVQDAHEILDIALN